MKYNKKQVTIYFILFSLLLIGVVYAILQANLQINGTAKIKANTWDIHFNNIVVNENSVSIGENDSGATIDPNDNCKVDFEVTLSLPGDFYEFTVDVVNAGTIDGMIGTLNKMLKVNSEVVSETPDYLNYSVTYSDGDEILENHKLDAGFTETYKVRLEFKMDIEELPEATTIVTSLAPQYLQADSTAVYRADADFATSSWDEIVKTYKIGNLTKLDQAMKAGTTREVQLDMDYDGTPETTRHVRIANLTKPAECSTTGFSQTACGFVIEFADIITTHEMNQTNNSGYSIGDGNKGGWEYSDMRAYLNSGKYLEGQSGEIDYTSEGICSALPENLRDLIVDSIVVSAYGLEDITNFITTDKLYLFSPKEIWEKSGSSSIDSYDSAWNLTRQLDYYANLNVTTSSYAKARKKDNGSQTIWWLRSALSNSKATFNYVNRDGSWTGNNSNLSFGVSPAFRIAE